MKRRTLLQGITTLAVLPLISACLREQENIETFNSVMIESLDKSPEEWRELVSPMAYKVLFEEATERPGSSALNHEDRVGTFICAACYLSLFESTYKYESGTGWPSFTQPIAGHIKTKRDFKMIVPRIEYHCARCGGHQGHVFNDGPQPRGERWCNNGIALQFVPMEEQLPVLRS